MENENKALTEIAMNASIVISASVIIFFAVIGLISWIMRVPKKPDDSQFLTKPESGDSGHWHGGGGYGK